MAIQKTRRARRSFTPEFKAEAVRLCKVGDRTIKQVAKDLDLTEIALRAWVQRAEVDDGKGDPETLTTTERDELRELRKRVKRLEMEREIQKSDGLLRQGERVKFELVDAEKANFPVGILCEVLKVSRSGFYAWKKRPPSPRSKEDAVLAVEITAAHNKSGKRYGSPRVHRALLKQGVRASAKRGARLMREQELVGRKSPTSAVRRTRTTRTRSRRTCSPGSSSRPRRTRQRRSPVRRSDGSTCPVSITPC